MPSSRAGARWVRPALVDASRDVGGGGGSWRTRAGAAADREVDGLTVLPVAGEAAAAGHQHRHIVLRDVVATAATPPRLPVTAGGSAPSAVPGGRRVAASGAVEAVAAAVVVSAPPPDSGGIPRLYRAATGRTGLPAVVQDQMATGLALPVPVPAAGSHAASGTAGTHEDLPTPVGISRLVATPPGPRAVGCLRLLAAAA